MAILAQLVLVPRALAEDTQILWNLKIVGQKAFSEGMLRDAILSDETSRIPLIGAVHKFDPVLFQSDLKRLEHFYKRNGYYQARVERSEVVPCSSPGRVCAKIQVNEGDPTVISKVAMRVGPARPTVTDDEMLRVFGMRVGQIFNHDEYLKQKTTIAKYLKEHSYPLPDVKGEAVYDESANTVALTIDVVPGTAAQLGYISFEGLSEIRPEDAAARLPLRTGDAYNPRAFDDAEALLSDLDVFRSIEVELKPRPGAPEIVDVVYHMREKPLKTLQFGAGIGLENSRQEARLRGEWTNRNFYSHLRHFNVRGEPSYAVLPSIFNPVHHGPFGTVEASMRHPAFLSPRQDLRTAIGFDSDLEQGYSWYGPRVSGNLERRITRRLMVSGGYSFRYLTFYDVDFIAATGEGFIPQELLFQSDYRLGYLSQRVTWDLRDQPLEPRRGFYSGIGLAESTPQLGSAFTYLRLEPEVRGYVPLDRHATIAAKATYGQLFPRQIDDSPITERFYGGGANSHRGFSYHRLSPAALGRNGRLEPIGGNASVLFSIEPRVDMFLLADRWVIGAVFFDAGDVVAKASRLDLTELHYAVGGGLRYDTPVGVIRADVGVRLNRLEPVTDGRINPDPGKRFAIHVSFGEAF